MSLLISVLNSMATQKKQNPEQIALGSPLFVRIVGSVMLSIISWVGYTTYQTSVEVRILNERTTSNMVSMKVDLEKAEIASKDHEYRIRKLEDTTAKVGGPGDPWYPKIENISASLRDMNDKITQVLAAVKQDHTGK